MPFDLAAVRELAFTNKPLPNLNAHTRVPIHTTQYDPKAGASSPLVSGLRGRTRPRPSGSFSVYTPHVDRSPTCSGHPPTHTLALIRSHLLRSPSRLREVIGAREFVDAFGPAKPHRKGERQNVFGGEDQLKVAPKGVEKTHPSV